MYRTTAIESNCTCFPGTDVTRLRDRSVGMFIGGIPLFARLRRHNVVNYNNNGTISEHWNVISLPVPVKLLTKLYARLSKSDETRPRSAPSVIT